MPTGYTSYIEDGKIQTGPEFLMLCARAFGACIDMRDEPLSKPIPDKFEPDGVYEKWLAQAKEKLTEYKAMTPEDIHNMNEKEYAERLADEELRQKRDAKMYAKYQKVREEVEQWVPPTLNHESLKEFALEQIDMCMEDYAPRVREVSRYTDDEWIDGLIKACEEDISRYERHIEKEKEVYEIRNKWIQDLRDNLKQKGGDD